LLWRDCAASCSSCRVFSFSASCFFSFTTGSWRPWHVWHTKLTTEQRKRFYNYYNLLTLLIHANKNVNNYFPCAEYLNTWCLPWLWTWNTQVLGHTNQEVIKTFKSYYTWNVYGHTIHATKFGAFNNLK
jgi:hypothetical protein